MRKDRGGDALGAEAHSGQETGRCGPSEAQQLRWLWLGDEERSLFNWFSSKDYYTGVRRHAGELQSGKTIDTSAGTPYDLPPFPAFYAISPAQVPGLLHFKYTSDTELSDAEAKAKILAGVEHLQKLGVLNNASKPEIAGYSNHSPFQLNVPARDIPMGFYKKLYAF